MQNSAVLEESPDENENEEFYDAMNREENKLDIDDEEWLTGIAPVMPKIILSLEKLRKDAATTEAELRMCEQSQYLEEFNRSYTLLSVWERLMDTIEYTQVIDRTQIHRMFILLEHLMRSFTKIH